MKPGEIVVSKYTGYRVLVSEVHEDGTFRGKLQGRNGYWWDRWEQSSFAPEAQPQPEEQKMACDCCGKVRPLTRVVAYGIETNACDECRGETSVNHL